MTFAKLPGLEDFVRFAPDFGQRYLVTVDVEEEFDWTRPIKREGFSLETVEAILDFQALCEQYGVIPLYLVDWPIINDPRGKQIYADLVRSGRAEVGIQLHPWVNPPFDEEVIQRNTYAGSLPPELERAKFVALRDAITEVTGTQPIAYRAGRYGIGPRTLDLLRETGVRYDTSVRANFDYRKAEGPDFSRYPLQPYWLDKTQEIVELPVTSVFWGLLRKQGKVFPLAQMAGLTKALMARGRLLERISLTPEGISVSEVIRGIDIALDDGLPILNFSFHSPSLRAGFTPYVRSSEDVTAFFDWWHRVLSYLAQRKIRPTSIAEIDAAIIR
ncbi:polysaccharide deacetylase family protein [Blastomonas sp.]|uniref:polysaccharide deacetylase family protein n=1 Tax=Blastomonas sp. TaxID=1909299 RepID=UPI0035940EAA